jgi:hypothetical protein
MIAVRRELLVAQHGGPRSMAEVLLFLELLRFDVAMEDRLLGGSRQSRTRVKLGSLLRLLWRHDGGKLANWTGNSSTKA